LEIETDGHFKKVRIGIREEVIRKRKASEDIEAQLAALEAQLRREKYGDTVPLMEPEAQGMAAD